MTAQTVLRNYLADHPYYIGKHRTDPREVGRIIYRQICQSTTFELHLEREPELLSNLSDSEIDDMRETMALDAFEVFEAFHTTPSMPAHYAAGAGFALRHSYDEPFITASIKSRAWVKKHQRELTAEATDYAERVLGKREHGRTETPSEAVSSF